MKNRTTWYLKKQFALQAIHSLLSNYILGKHLREEEIELGLRYQFLTYSHRYNFAYTFAS